MVGQISTLLKFIKIKKTDRVFYLSEKERFSKLCLTRIPDITGELPTMEGAMTRAVRKNLVNHVNQFTIAVLNPKEVPLGRGEEMEMMEMMEMMDVMVEMEMMGFLEWMVYQDQLDQLDPAPII
jgi:hypothetical protein